MSQKYYILDGGAPVEIEEETLITKIAEKAIDRSDACCMAGETTWKTVGDYFPLVEAEATLKPSASVPQPVDANPSEGTDEAAKAKRVDTPTYAPVAPEFIPSDFPDEAKAKLANGKCLHCETEIKTRGLCSSHYAALKRLVTKKLTTWDEQEERHNALPPQKGRSTRVTLGGTASAFLSETEYQTRLVSAAQAQADQHTLPLDD